MVWKNLFRSKFYSFKRCYLASVLFTVDKCERKSMSSAGPTGKMNGKECPKHLFSCTPTACNLRMTQHAYKEKSRVTQIAHAFNYDECAGLALLWDRNGRVSHTLVFIFLKKSFPFFNPPQCHPHHPPASPCSGRCSWHSPLVPWPLGLWRGSGKTEKERHKREEKLNHMGGETEGGAATEGRGEGT